MRIGALGRGLAAAGATMALTAASGLAASPTPGSDGVGDSFFPKSGNGGYDAGYYDIYLRYDPEENRFTGPTRTKIYATVTQPGGLDKLNLDFTGLNVTEVLVDGVPSPRSRAGQELTVDPVAPLADGARFDVEVRYGGEPDQITDPDGGIEGWVRTSDGAFVVGEPLGSTAWFPSNNHPTDKASFQIAVEVPRPYKAISNGTLGKVEWASGGRRIFIWSGAAPMATYLATATVGRFKTVADKTVPGPIDYSYTAIDRSFGGDDGAVSRSVEIARFLAERFGPYPFDEIGGIVDRVRNVNYALETQTRPIYPGPPGSVLTAHEIAHQWLGNQITLADWSEIWLNEGFATWAEWRWAQHDGGQSAAGALGDICAIGPGDRFWDLPPASLPGPEVMFDGRVYRRGAAALQALRELIGGAEFLAAIRAWAGQDPNGAYTTADLIALVKSVSAAPDAAIDAHFSDWVYDAGKPAGCAGAKAGPGSLGAVLGPGDLAPRR